MRRSRIVFASYALRGHINKCIVLATELAERGHSVFFATQEEGRAWLSHPAIRYVAWEPRWAAKEGGSFLEHLRAVRGAISEQRNEYRRLALSVGDAAEVYAPAFDSLKAVLQPVAPDLLIVPHVLGPGMDVAHEMNLPLIILSGFLPKLLRLHPMVSMPDARSRPVWRRRIVSIPWIVVRERARRRLERVRRARSRCLSPNELLRRATVVAMTDASIEVGDTFVPNVRLVGPLIPNPLPALPEPTRQWIERQAPSGIVLVAIGTLVKLHERQLAALAEGLADCGAGVLWALPEHQHRLVQSHSASFRAETFVAQATILSRADVRAFVTHAGANSALEAMYWGRPTLGLPFMFDQHYYARRAVDLSMGLELEPHVLTSDDVRGAVRRLLHERTFADAARRLAMRLQRTPGVKGAADIVEAELARQSAGA